MALERKIAVVGGGISGLAAAYELERARRAGAPVDWRLYEAGPRLGGVVETTRLAAAGGTFVLEGGPDAWVSEKSAARDLAVELGLEAELLPSNDATRKTWMFLDGRLQAIPDRMRMMVPEGEAGLAAVDASGMFSEAAKAAFRREVERAEELRRSAPDADETVAAFVRRHFGEEVLEKLARPLLSGVFGGDVDKLSVRAVMPAFVAMEREFGSLVAGLGRKAEARAGKVQQPVFTTLRGGMGSLVEALARFLPAERVHRRVGVRSVSRARGGGGFDPAGWVLRLDPTDPNHCEPCETVYMGFDAVLLATQLDTMRSLLHEVDAAGSDLLPGEASSAVLAALVWPAGAPQPELPAGFGFLVPPGTRLAAMENQPEGTPSLLAGTFVDAKFAERAPAGARVVRAFFGCRSVGDFAGVPDAEVARVALEQLREVVGPLPEPDFTLTQVRRWPRSLPQYGVGHLERMDALDARVAKLPGFALLGNSLRGVGVPDLIAAGRAKAKRLVVGS